MAFSCVLYLKSECDGCGMCDEPAVLDADDDDYDPFWDDIEEEEE